MKENKQVTINQHYVPQFYLNNFSYLNKKGKACLDVLDIDTGKILRKQKIQNIASENYFYDLDLEKYLANATRKSKLLISILLKIKYGIKFKLSSFKNLNRVENVLGDIESNTSPILIKLIDKAEEFTLWERENCYILNDEEKLSLSKYLAIQFQRTPKVRQTIQETNQYLKADVYRELLYRQTGEILEIDALIKDVNKENIKHQHLDFMFNQYTDKIAYIFYKHSWVFYKNMTDVDFITSDSPISTQATKDETIMSFSGISSEGVIVIFPISKKLILVMYEKNLNKQQNDKKLHIFDDPKTIEAFNMVILLSCHRFLYGNADELEKLLEFIKIRKKSTDRKTIIANSMIPKE